MPIICDIQWPNFDANHSGDAKHGISDAARIRGDLLVNIYIYIYMNLEVFLFSQILEMEGNLCCYGLLVFNPESTIYSYVRIIALPFFKLIDKDILVSCWRNLK